MFSPGRLAKYSSTPVYWASPANSVLLTQELAMCDGSILASASLMAEEDDEVRAAVATGAREDRDIRGELRISGAIRPFFCYTVRRPL